MKIMDEGNKAHDIHNYAVLMQKLCEKMAWYFKSKNHAIQQVDTRIGLIEDSGDWKLFGKYQNCALLKTSSSMALARIS